MTEEGNSERGGFVVRRETGGDLLYFSMESIFLPEVWSFMFWLSDFMVRRGEGFGR